MKKIDGIWKVNCLMINTATVNLKTLEKIEKLLKKEKAVFKEAYRHEYDKST